MRLNWALATMRCNQSLSRGGGTAVQLMELSFMGTHMRIQPIDPLNLSPLQQTVYDEVTSGPRGQVRGPLAVWLHQPAFAGHAQKLGAYCRYETLLPARLSELAVLCIAAHWSSEFEWWAHKPIAMRAGISEDVIQALRTGRKPDLELEDEALVYDFVHDLMINRKVADPHYDYAIRLFGSAGVVDLVGIVGYYTLISMTINVFQIDLPDGAAPELETGSQGD